MESQKRLRDCVKALIDVGLTGWNLEFIQNMYMWIGDYSYDKGGQADKIVEIYDREV